MTSCHTQILVHESKSDRGDQRLTRHRVSRFRPCARDFGNDLGLAVATPPTCSWSVVPLLAFCILLERDLVPSIEVGKEEEEQQRARETSGCEWQRRQRPPCYCSTSSSYYTELLLY